MTATIETPTTDQIVPEPTPYQAAMIALGERASASAGNARPAEVAILGYEVSWGVPGLAIPAAELLRRLTEAGFAEAMPKRRPSEQRNLRRAIVEWASARAIKPLDGYELGDGEEVSRRKKLVRKVEGVRAQDGAAAPVVLALVQEVSVGAALALDFATAYRFVLTPPSGEEREYRLRVSTEGRGRIEEYEAREEERRRVQEEILPIWEKHRDLYSGADLSALLIDLVHSLDGISVESGSGVYFLPERQSGAVDRLERLVRGFADLKEAGTPPHFRVRENIDWPRTRRALAEAALDDIASELREAERSIAGFESANEERPGSVKITTAKGIITDLLRVKRKYDFYAETMGMREQRLVGEMNALGARARTLAVANRDARQARMGGPVAPAPGQLAIVRGPRQERAG